MNKVITIALLALGFIAIESAFADNSAYRPLKTRGARDPRPLAVQRADATKNPDLSQKGSPLPTESKDPKLKRANGSPNLQG